MPAGDLYRATVNWLVNDKRASNVFHFLQQDADGSEDPAESLVTGIIEQYSTALGFLTNQTVLDTIAVKRILPTPTQTRTFGGDGTGTVNEESLPPQTNMTMSLYTNVFSKRGRGRVRIPGLGIGSVQNSNFKSEALGNWLSWFETFVAVWTATGSAIGWLYVVYSTIDAAARSVHKVSAHADARKQRSRKK